MTATTTARDGPPTRPSRTPPGWCSRATATSTPRSATSPRRRPVPASFYNYYDTKADLLIALAEEFHAEATSLAALPFQAGLARPEALREAVAGFWRTYAKRRGELIGIFQAAMVEGRFRDRWLELRGEAINRIAGEVRAAQAHGYCPGVDPVMTASALSAMLEHFCYIWLGQGGEKDVPFDDERALDAVATIWQKAVYWRAEPG